MKLRFIAMLHLGKSTIAVHKLSIIFKVRGSVYRKNILIYIQQAATLHSLFYLETALHVSGGIITHHHERKQLYLQHHVRPLLLPAAIAASSSNGSNNAQI